MTGPERPSAPRGSDDEPDGASPGPTPGVADRLSGADLDAVRRLFDEAIPFNKFLGLRLVELERGRALCRLPFRPELVGDPLRPALHGGVLSMIADTVGGAAVFTVTRPGDRVATIDLRIDYLRPGRLEDVVGEARVVRIGNRVGVSTITLTQPGEPEPIALAMGVYTVRRSG